MEPDKILDNTRIRKPLVCDTCKSEFVSHIKSRNKCEHLELVTNTVQNGKYHEIIKKNLYITLDKVNKHSNSLNKDITNTEDKLRNYYDKIRSDIDHTIDLKISEIMDEKRVLFDEIAAYHHECLLNFRTCNVYKQSLLDYIEQINAFYDEWQNKQVGPDKNKEILKAYEDAYTHKIELERKKIQFESFIFNKKIEFHESPDHKVGFLCDIFDHLPKFDQWNRIDLKQTLFLSITKEPSIKKPFIIIEEFDSKNLFCCYVNTNPNMFGISKIKLVITDSNGHYLRSINEETYENEFKVYKFKDLILVSLYSKIGRSNLKVYDENLHRVFYIESLILNSPVTSLYANDNYIYISYLSDDNFGQTIIYALNWQLEYVESTELNSSANKMSFPFYFPKEVDQIECYDSKMFLKFGNTITVVNEENGEIMKVLEIPCSCDFVIDTSGFFVIFCHGLKKIFYLNLNCDILDQNELIDFPRNLKFYYNKYQRTIFFYDSLQYFLYKMKNEKRIFKNSIHWYLEVN